VAAGQAGAVRRDLVTPPRSGLRSGGGPYLTLKVSRDSGRTWGPEIVYQPARGPWELPTSHGMEPCRCVRCQAGEGMEST
jgi:hypothetical protein